MQFCEPGGEALNMKQQKELGNRKEEKENRKKEREKRQG
jgi:hypothetical protein